LISVPWGPAVRGKKIGYRRMIITPEFVFVHCQKTGGTFVSDALRKLLCPNQRLELLYRIRRKYGIALPFFNYRYRDFLSKENGQHAWCDEIPVEDREKRIVSIVRSPYDYYVSAYAFGWWKKDLKGCLKNERYRYFEDKHAALEKYPNLLESDFPEFLKASWEFSRWTRKTIERHPNARDLGMCTQRFIYFFCKDHAYVFEAAHDPRLLLERVREKQYGVHFLRQENLNQDLYAFLSSLGYPESDIGFILKKGAVNVSRKTQGFLQFYDDSLKEKVQKADALLFELFPDYDK
jgi:hypothetical protein